jgi:hypothetical protein
MLAFPPGVSRLSVGGPDGPLRLGTPLVCGSRPAFRQRTPLPTAADRSTGRVLEQAGAKLVVFHECVDLFRGRPLRFVTLRHLSRRSLLVGTGGFFVLRTPSSFVPVPPLQRIPIVVGLCWGCSRPFGFGCLFFVETAAKFVLESGLRADRHLARPFVRYGRRFNERWFLHVRVEFLTEQVVVVQVDRPGELVCGRKLNAQQFFRDRLNLVVVGIFG